MSARFRLHIVRVSSPPEGSVPAERSREPEAAQLPLGIPGTPAKPERSVTTEALLAYTMTLLSSYKKAATP